MKYSYSQITEIEKLITKLDYKLQELHSLKSDMEIISGSDGSVYKIEFYFRGDTHKFDVSSITIIGFYDMKINNLTNEIESLEKRLQELVK